MMPTMDGRGIAYWRMHNLRLWGNPFEAPEDVVGWLGAVQSQDYDPAKWSVAMRSRDAGDDIVEKAFADGAILRTHVLRPTWHFVLPADIRWMLELTAPRVHAINAHRYRELDPDGSVRQRSTPLITKALHSEGQLTRNEIKAMLEAAGIAAEGQRIPYILMNAELNGIVCSGARSGKQHTYALLEERAPQARSLSPDDALAELTLRYFTSRGPATAKDFRSWSSLTLAEIKRGLEMVAHRLHHEDIDGASYWFAEPAPRSKPPSPTVHLLQGYDEYMSGYQQSRHVIDVSGVVASVPEGTSVPNGVAILDGQIAGRWKRTVRKSSVVVEVALYAPLNAAQMRALQAAADRYGEFLGLPASVETRPI